MCVTLSTKKVHKGIINSDHIKRQKTIICSNLHIEALLHEREKAIPSSIAVYCNTLFQDNAPAVNMCYFLKFSFVTRLSIP